MAASAAALALLRADLGYTADTVPEEVSLLLASDLETAAADLARMGVAVDEAVPADLNLLTVYAAWLYRKRVTGEPRPPMLKILINDRKVAAATGGVS